MANTRELSQLASLINVNDETKSIRVIANQPEAKIGIGTENPITKVDVSGDVNVSGAVTATSFYGDGSSLSNIISGVGIQSAGSIIGTGVTTLNFVGAGNTFTINGSTVDISISGGGASVSISTEAPSNPSEGDLWYSSILGRTFIYYSDADSSQWVDTAPFNQSLIEVGVGIATAGGIVGYGVTTLDFRGSGISTVTVASSTGTIFIEGGGGGASVSISTEAPSNPSEGDLWYSPTYGRTFIYYSDADSSQWVDTAPFNISNSTSAESYWSGTQAGIHTLSNVGIGTTNPTSKLYVLGDATIVGTTTVTALVETSSIALKENINPIENALDKILQLNPVTYDRKNNISKNEAGLIAEEVNEVLPNIVTKDGNGNPEGINYTKLSVYLIDAIKTLQKEIEDLRNGNS